MKITLKYKIALIEDIAADRYGIACRSQMFRIHSSPEMHFELFNDNPTEYFPTVKTVIINSMLHTYGPLSYRDFNNDQVRKMVIHDNLNHITKMIRAELAEQEITEITGIDWQYDGLVDR